MEKRVSHDIGGNLISTAQYEGVMVSKISYVSDASHQRLDDNRKRSWRRWIENFAQIPRCHEYNLRYRIMQPLDFTVIDWLYLPPELPDVLFLVVVRKDFAETFECNHLWRHVIPPQDGLKAGGGPGHQAKPQIT